MRFLKFRGLRLTILSFTVLLSCSESKTFFVSPENPVFRKDLVAMGDEYYRAEADKALSELTLLGALDSQIDPCHCFMRPFGGLKRIGNHLQRTQSPLVLSGPLTQPSPEEPLPTSAVYPAIATFLKKTDVVAMAFDPEDDAFWQKHRAGLSKLPLVASNLQIKGDSKDTIGFKPFVDVKFGLQTFRFFYFVSSKTKSDRWQVLPVAESFAKFLRETPKDVVFVAMSDTFDEISEIARVRSNDRAFVTIASWTVASTAKVETENMWTKIFLERRTRSVAHLKWPATKPFANELLVDLVSLEQEAELYRDTLTRVIGESRTKKEFKETPKGFELPIGEQTFFKAFLNTLPKEKLPKLPMKSRSVNLTDAYDKP